jgi:hypothetical protein
MQPALPRVRNRRSAGGPADVGVTRFLLPVDDRHHSTAFGGNRGQGLLAIPHGPGLAANCAGGRLIGPLSWLQVQGRRTAPFQRIGIWSCVMLEALSGGIDRSNASAIKSLRFMHVKFSRRACAAAAGALGGREPGYHPNAVDSRIRPTANVRRADRAVTAVKM